MMKVGIKLNAAWVSAVVFTLGAASALANGVGSSTIALNDPLGGASFETVVNNVISFLSTDIAIPLTAIMVLVGAFQMSTSAGDPEKFSQARKTILYAAIGFGIALIATGVTSIIKNLIGGN